MLNVSITIPKDTATPALARLRAGLNPDRLLPILGRSVNNAVRENFDMLEQSRPNKLGGQRQHYYSGARASTSFVVDGDQAVIGVRQVGMRLRYYGGTVTAGKNASYMTGAPTKYLTIPVTPESYGHRAADFPDLKVLWGASGPYALARVTQGTIAKGPNARTVTAEVLFILKKSVDVEADKTMLPDSETMESHVKEDFYRYVDLLWRRLGENFA